MTREDAIAYGKRVIGLGLNDETQAFCEIAIQALEQEPCEDVISRQAVNEIINDIRDCISVEGYCAIIERMKKLPPVNSQEPKTRMWKYIQYDKPSIGNWHCSECGRIVFLLNSQKSSETPLYNYCPWCGAKMQG